MMTRALRPAVSPVEFGTTTEAVIDRLRQAIRAGLYAPGQRLHEADLVREFGVSRGPIREAMYKLIGEGLISTAPYRGFTVKRLSRREVLDSYQALELLDGLVVRLAAQRIDEVPSAKAALSKLLADFKRSGAARNLPRHIALKADIQSALVGIGGNAQLPALLARLRSPIFTLQARGYMQAENLDSLNHEYARIIRAVLEGDAEAAERSMRHYIAQISALIMALPDHCFA
jgi:DNA-binding GntR family transcriptional regulator